MNRADYYQEGLHKNPFRRRFNRIKADLEVAEKEYAEHLKLLQKECPHANTTYQYDAVLNDGGYECLDCEKWLGKNWKG